MTSGEKPEIALDSVRAMLNRGRSEKKVEKADDSKKKMLAVKLQVMAHAMKGRYLEPSWRKKSLPE